MEADREQCSAFRQSRVLPAWLPPDSASSCSWPARGIPENLMIRFAFISSWLAFIVLAPELVALPLVVEGQPRAVIVVEDARNGFHLTAAQDLQAHLKRASGANVAIVHEVNRGAIDPTWVQLIVGAGALAEQKGVTTADLLPEAYRVSTKGNSIVFVGRDIAGTSNATAWAVSAFLDRYLGVRWLWPGELGTHVPPQATIDVPEINLSGRPALEQRRLRARADGEVGDWLRHHQMGSRMKFSFGHAYTTWWPKYKDTHPEYFAVPPPGRKQPYPQPDRVKLRIGNPAVGDQIIENWRQAGRPDNWNVCPNDGSGWDTSEESRALDLPDVFTPEDIWSNKANLARRFIRFWNSLLVRMRAENPNVTLSTYAYSCYREPPADVKLEPGMVVGIVHTYASFAGWQVWNDAGAKLILRPNWWHIGGSGPHIPLHQQGEYFRYAYAHAMIGFDFDSLTGHWSNQSPLYYVIARLSVRPDLTVEQVIDEYTGAFGSAAAIVREYLNYWEDFTRKVASPVTAGGDISQDPNGLYETLARKHGINVGTLSGSWRMMPFLYTDEIIAPGEKILVRAQAAAANDRTVVRDRIGFLQAGLQLLKEHREIVRLAMKQTRRAGETEKTFAAACERFEALRRELTARYGVIGFGQTIPSRLQIKDPRTLEGL